MEKKKVIKKKGNTKPINNITVSEKPKSKRVKTSAIITLVIDIVLLVGTFIGFYHYYQ